MQARKNRIGDTITMLDENDMSTLVNICRVAAERFDTHAAEFRKLVDYVPPPPAENEDGSITFGPPHGTAAARIAEQFESQAKEARKFLDLFNDSTMAEMVTPAEEDDEAA